MKQIAIALAASALLVGCDAVDNYVGKKHELEIGRFQPLPRVGSEDQMILDTATGCVVRSGAVSFDNSGKPKPYACETVRPVPPDIQKIIDKYGAGKPEATEAKQ